MMTARPLQLRRCDTTQREIAAWFLLGGGPADWLGEMTRWEVPLEGVSCYVAPRAAGDYQAGGLLVIPPKGSARPKSTRALELGVWGGKLYLPADAALFPPASDAEIGVLCRAAITLFHPAIGLVEFDSADACGAWQLLAPPETVMADWNAARAGAELNSRLAAVVRQALPQIEDIFGEAEKEIGSDPMENLPPRPNEPSAGLPGKMGRALRGMGAGAVQKFFSMLPSGGSKPNWINHVLDWASAKLSHVTEEMEDLRHSELLRLMQMLESDPDRGLRHALPLGGAPGRGQALPGARLGSRNVNFNLRNIGGGQASDPWNVPWELRQKLLKRYRELASHERQLGRFKRAAYIYAELLGDLASAAAVLKEGRLFAEAAVLYRDHLRQPMAAAECFVAGGLFAEAVAIYEKEGQWLELGDLHRRLENEEAAAIAYRRAVEVKVAAVDFVGAAQLLDQRLRVPDEAIALLRRGWPNGPQATQCLNEEFGMLGRLGRHDAATQRLTELRREATPVAKCIPLGEVLDTLGKKYPDTTVRSVATDLARIKISERLADDDLEHLRRGTQIVARLAPKDRLLSRDASRFLAMRTAELQRRPTLPPPLPPPRKAGSGRLNQPSHLGSVRLPSGLQWIGVRRVGPRFVALVNKRNQAVFLRGNWQGQFQEVPASFMREKARPSPQAFIADEAISQPAFLIPSPLPSQRGVQTIPPTDLCPAPLRIGVPAWIPEAALLMSISGAQWWLLRLSSEGLALEEWAADGRLVGTFDVSSVLDSANQGPLSLLALRGHVWIACGTNLVLFKNGRIERRWQLESPIQGFEASAPFLSCAMVARCEQGVAVFWLDALADRVDMIASHLTRPRAVFLGNGTLVLLAGTSDGRGCDGTIVDIDRRGIHSEEKFYKNGRPPIGLIGTDRPDDFAVFDGTDSAEIWRVTTKS